MKKYLFLLALAALFVSCKTSVPVEKYPNMVADADPLLIGMTNASHDRSFSSNLARVSVEIIFYPRENEVALEFNHSSGGVYRQFWNQAARQHFIGSLNNYNEAFTGQTLTTNYNKSKRVYGKVQGRFEWKPLKISSTYRSSPIIELGYRFRDNAPYFATYQPTANEQSGAHKGITKSPAYSLYFTRAQAEEIARVFDQAFLLQSVANAPPPPKPEDNRDEYYNRGDANTD